MDKRTFLKNEDLAGLVGIQSIDSLAETGRSLSEGIKITFNLKL